MSIIVKGDIIGEYQSQARTYGTFHSEAGPSTEASRRLTETETKQMILQYFIHKKPINTELGRTIKECEDYIGKFMIWLAEQRDCSVGDLIDSAIQAYHEVWWRRVIETISCGS
jgi:hypothetical protein